MYRSSCIWTNMYDLRKRVQSCKLASRFCLTQGFLACHPKCFHYYIWPLVPKMSWNYKFQPSSKFIFKTQRCHLHQPFLNIHSSDGLIPCAKRNEWKKLQTLFQKLAITKPYLPSLMYLLSSWKEYGIKSATDGTFKIWNLAKCINIQCSTLTIYTYERA